MIESKIKLIDEIVKLHPSAGTKRGWSYYTGGMADTGDWYYRKMMDVPVEELQKFLDDYIAENNRPLAPLTEQEIADQKIIITIKNGNGFVKTNKYEYDKITKFYEEQDRKLLFPDEPQVPITTIEPENPNIPSFSEAAVKRLLED
jgi:hypothetical protein